MDKPFEIFSEYLDDLFKIFDASIIIKIFQKLKKYSIYYRMNKLFK